MGLARSWRVVGESPPRVAGRGGSRGKELMAERIGERARLGAPQPRIPERGCCRMVRASSEGSPGPPVARSRRILSQERGSESRDEKVTDTDQ